MECSLEVAAAGVDPHRAPPGVVFPNGLSKVCFKVVGYDEKLSRVCCSFRVCCSLFPGTQDVAQRLLYKSWAKLFWPHAEPSFPKGQTLIIIAPKNN